MQICSYLSKLAFLVNSCFLSYADRSFSANKILLVFTKDFVATITKIKLKQLKFEPHQFCDYWPVAMAMLDNSKVQSICPLIVFSEYVSPLF